MVVRLTSLDASTEGRVPNLNTRAVSTGVVAVVVVLLASVVLVGAGVVQPVGLGRTEFASAVAGTPAGTVTASGTKRE